MQIGLAYLRFQSTGERAAGARKAGRWGDGEMGRWAREEDVSGVTR